LQHLCGRAGFTPPDDQGVHDAYSRAVRDWEGQVLAKRAGGCSCSTCCFLCSRSACSSPWTKVYRLRGTQAR
jgi:hypothetical protein